VFSKITSHPAACVVLGTLRNDSGAVSRIERFNPAFCLTFLPELTLVPPGDAVVFLVGTSSLTISRWSPINLAVT
jgi:hypothetical protein